MTVHCMKACGFCGRACTSYSNGKTEGCEDKTPFCSLGSSSHCQRASKWYNYMATNCRRRCGLCGASNGNNSDCRGTCPRTRKNPARYCEDACNPSDGCQGNKKCVCDGNCGYSCVPNGLSCSRLPRFQNGRKSVIGGRSFNASIRYRCNKPYTLLGSATRTCRGIGRWDGKRARCKIICNKPRDIPFGNKRMDGRRKGNNVTYWCFPGYTLNGAATITCGRNAKWNRDPPCCVRKETYYRDSGIHTNHTGGLDLVFVFDGSNSVSGKEFKKGLNFAVTLVDMLGATWKPGETQVAAVTYGTDAELVFNLGDDEFNTANEVKKKIRGIHQPRGGTATRLALDMVRKVVAPNTRSLAQKVLFFITDGKYNIGGKLEEAAKTLRKKKKFEIYAIVVGKKPKLCELMYIASQPYEEHILDVKNQKTLRDAIEQARIIRIDYSPCGVSGANFRARIVGGHKVRRGTWPWQVGIYYHGGQRHTYPFCGGSLIDKRWVLTAAHCFYRRGQRIDFLAILYSVRVGDHYILKKEAQEQDPITAQDIFLHHGFQQATLTNDVALIKLNEEVKLGKYVRTVCLPKHSQDDLAMGGTYGYVAGWGSTQKLRPGQMPKRRFLHSKVLRHTALTIQADGVCMNSTRYFVNTSVTFCAGQSEGGNDTCRGNTGGPFVRQIYNSVLRAHRWTQVGIVSWGEGCAMKNRYGFYTRVAPFVD